MIARWVLTAILGVVIGPLYCAAQMPVPGEKG